MINSCLRTQGKAQLYATWNPVHKPIQNIYDLNLYFITVECPMSSIAKEPGKHSEVKAIYKHRPLEGPGWIRIIQLLPSTSFQDLLICHITHLNRDHLRLSLDESENHYDAVSYVWGEPVFSHTLLVLDKARCREDASQFAITLAVDEMLRRFRQRANLCVLNLWVDAICLNQKDRQEIQAQVFRMGSIYSEARKVRVWLGPEADDAAAAFSYLRQLSLSRRSVAGPYRATPTTTVVGDESGKTTPAQQHKTLAELIPVSNLEALQKLFERQFFTRRWCCKKLLWASKQSSLSAICVSRLAKSKRDWMFY